MNLLQEREDMNKTLMGMVLIMAIAMNVSAQTSHFADILSKKEAFLPQKFPIGFYTDCYNLADEDHAKIFQDDSEVRDWAEMGATLMLSPRFTSEDPVQRGRIQELLRACERYGIRMLLADRRFYQQGMKGMSEEAYRKEVEEAGSYFSRFPAFAGFMIQDEPGKDIMADVALAMRLHKEVLPNSLPFLNLGYEPSHMGKKTWPEFFDFVLQESRADILSYDYYGQLLSDSKIPYYFMVLKHMREASLRNGVPFWFVELCVPHMHFRNPSYDDIRWQFNTAICSGASGILWFFYYQGDSPNANYRLAPVDMNGDKTETWHHLKRVHRDFLNHYGDLFTRLVSTHVTHFPKIVAGETWTPNRLLAEIKTDIPDHPLVVGEFTDKERQTYLMVVNRSMSATGSVAVTLTFPQGSRIFHYHKAKEYEGRALEHGGAIVAEANGFSIKHWLAPGQEVVYRVEPAPETEAIEPVESEKKE